MDGEQETYSKFKPGKCSDYSRACFVHRLGEASRRSIGIDRLSKWLMLLYASISRLSGF